MSDKKISLKKESSNSTPTIISKDLTVEGEISGQGLVEIEGKVNGKINSASVVIRESGFVEGFITAQSLIIKGQFNGEINADHLHITSKAKITGTITYETMSVEDGASIDGQFKKSASQLKTN